MPGPPDPLLSQPNDGRRHPRWLRLLQHNESRQETLFFPFPRPDACQPWPTTTNTGDGKPPAHAAGGLCTSAKGRNDFLRVIGDQPLFVTIIKINVELHDARFSQLLEFGD